jgi:uncharacterized protein (DUF58 family)
MYDVPRSILRRIRISSTKRLNAEFTGQYRSAFKGYGLLFDGVREYQPGDEVRYIDWNVSARSSHLYVKQYIEERELSIVIACDVSASMKFGSSREKREAMLETAALVMQCAAINNDRLSVLLFSDSVEKYFAPKKGSKYLLKVLNDINAWNPKGKETDVACAAEFLQKVLKKRSIIFFISDFIDEGYLSKFKILSRKHDLIPVRVSDPLEGEMNLFGLAGFLDLESGDVVYADAMPGKTEDIIEGFESLYVTTGAPAFAAVHEYFKKRNKRRVRRW